MSFDGRQIKYNPRLSVDLFSEESGHEPYTSSSVEKVTNEYIDFNDDGEEVVKQEVKYVVVENTTTVKLKKDLNVIGSDLYNFAYTKLKEKYKRDFDPCVIEDI